MLRKILFTVPLLFILTLGFAQPTVYHTKPFVHPGMDQAKRDLEFMKQKVLAGEQPWKAAFEKLKENTPASFIPEPRAHISVGAFGANSSGGKEFSSSAQQSYNNALLWYITGKKDYAGKAIEILNAWSPVLWDFDDNNAKLNVGMSGSLFLNAAELLRYSNAGWQEKDMQQFKRMVLTVFYPTIKDFFSEANGNWDGTMMNTLLCIGVFTDDHQIFNSAIERYYRGPGNSGITKYIYPNGQIQETTRDWDHVQMGIGYLGKTAQVAWTQGLDLYSVAGNRLALGFEYSSKYLSGNDDIPVYGKLSARERGKLRDMYENVYDHYRTAGIGMPYTAMVTKKQRPNSTVELLTGLRAPAPPVSKTSAGTALPLRIFPIVSIAGAQKPDPSKFPAKRVMVAFADSIQPALDAMAGKGGWVILDKGIFLLKAALRIPSGVTLCGQGRETVLFLSPAVNGKTIVNAEAGMHDVTIRDLLLEGAVSTADETDPNASRRTRSYMSAPGREGIAFAGEKAEQMTNIRLENLTVQNFTKNGVAIRGAWQVIISQCDFSDNGSSVVPGAGFHHNLLLTRSAGCTVSDSRFDSSPWGNGIELSFSRDVKITGNELARNKLSGIRCTESTGVLISGNLAEGNDVNGISLESLMEGTTRSEISGNLSWHNGQYGIFQGKTAGNTVNNNRTADNGKN
ncbi:alginate lyase family protein [Hufsiella ginkgonis]|uniref:Alginate lyase domain-containing protein n=1 Tax=Hufsiella ginkgonis TaxID=2695274 RepID=A0A7K1Y321_9SPHI|nr:alginate lyase family protein [Hufsiella ginkgonis]MXV17670.1 hypothetical protein [Hufsiella ginkgonis]